MSEVVDGNFGPRDNFGVRVIGGVARAGLHTLGSSADLFVDQRHLQDFVTNFTEPVLRN